MGKKVKNIILGANVMENLIKSRQSEKIRSIIQEGRFSPEAIRVLFDSNPFINENISLAYDVLERGEYRFEDVYGSFETYVNSHLAKSLLPIGENGDRISWISNIPRSSEELSELYFSADDITRSVIYKTLLFRMRRMDLQGQLYQDYCNCAKAIIQIHRDRNPSATEEDVYSYYIRWAWVIDEAIVKEAEGVMGADKLYNLLEFRVSGRYCYGITETVLMELPITLKYMSSNREGRIIPIRDFVRCLGLSPKLEISRSELAETAYREAIRPFIFSGSFKDRVDKLSSTGDYLVFIFMLEEDEDKKNLIFKVAVKERGYNSFASDISQRAHQGFSYSFTKEIVEFSKLLSSDFNSLLIEDEIKTAEGVLNLKEECLIKDNGIPYFYRNRVLSDKIRLDTFSEEELTKLSPRLNWERIDCYFYAQRCPIDFILRNIDKFSETSISYSIEDSGASASEVISIAEGMGGKLSRRTFETLFKTALSSNKKATAEQIAKLIRFEEFPTYTEVKGMGENEAASIQSILTLL